MDDKVKVDTTVITLQGLEKDYAGTTVLHDIQFSVQAGECVVLVGHNGAGKTSLMKLMLGLTRPSRGDIEVLGLKPGQGAGGVRKMALGYLPESVAFYEAMTGREVLRFYAKLKSVSSAAVDNLLQLVGLAEAAQKRVGTYSKGMRQRLGLAQAMLGDPRLLFLDEPTTGLDPALRQHFYQLIDALHKKGVTSIISSHALNEVEARADRFVIMKRGRIVASGALEALFQQAALPTRIRLEVKAGLASELADRLGSAVNISDINKLRISLSCRNGEKMPLIRHIASLGEAVQDIHIEPPRLDEVYRHFMSDELS